MYRLQFRLNRFENIYDPYPVVSVKYLATQRRGKNSIIIGFFYNYLHFVETKNAKKNFILNKTFVFLKTGHA